MPPAGRRIGLLFATSGHSGVDRVIANLLPEFGRSDFEFDLLTIGGHGPAIPTSLPDNIRVIRLPVRTKKLVVIPLIAYLLRYRPATLLTANHQLNRAALCARALTRLPMRVVIRMGMSLTAQGQAMGDRRRTALHRSMRRWYPRADAVIAPSQGVGQDLINIAGVSPRRLHVIRNPIVNNELYRSAAQEPDHPWFRGEHPPIILGVGSLEPRKDFATLVRAFARVRQHQDCRLVILGEGGERKHLQRLVEEVGVQRDVDLPGFADQPYPYMQRAAVFALASRREGASAVIVEALACGTPVVSTDCPSGPGEVLGPMGSRALVPIGDDEALAEKLLQTLQSPPLKSELASLIQEHEVTYSARRYLAAIDP